jgi:hypothetical protein
VEVMNVLSQQQNGMNNRQRPVSLLWKAVGRIAETQQVVMMMMKNVAPPW